MHMHLPQLKRALLVLKVLAAGLVTAVLRSNEEVTLPPVLTLRRLQPAVSQMKIRTRERSRLTKKSGRVDLP